MSIESIGMCIQYYFQGKWFTMKVADVYDRAEKVKALQAMGLLVIY